MEEYQSGVDYEIRRKKVPGKVKATVAGLAVAAAVKILGGSKGTSGAEVTDLNKVTDSPTPTLIASTTPTPEERSEYPTLDQELAGQATVIAPSEDNEEGGVVETVKVTPSATPESEEWKTNWPKSDVFPDLTKEKNGGFYYFSQEGIDSPYNLFGLEEYIQSLPENEQRHAEEKVMALAIITSRQIPANALKEIIEIEMQEFRLYEENQSKVDNLELVYVESEGERRAILSPKEIVSYVDLPIQKYFTRTRAIPRDYLAEHPEIAVSMYQYCLDKVSEKKKMVMEEGVAMDLEDRKADLAWVLDRLEIIGDISGLATDGLILEKEVWEINQEGESLFDQLGSRINKLTAILVLENLNLEESFSIDQFDPSKNNLKRPFYDLLVLDAETATRIISMDEDIVESLPDYSKLIRAYPKFFRNVNSDPENVSQPLKELPTSVSGGTRVLKDQHANKQKEWSKHHARGGRKGKMPPWV